MNPDYAALIAALYPEAQWSLSGEDYSGLLWFDESPKPSQNDLDSAWPQFEYDRDYAFVEMQRRARYQIETDGMFFAAQREGGDLSEWEAAVAAIKAELPYPTAP